MAVPGLEPSSDRRLGARIVLPVVRPASLGSLLPVAAAMAMAEDGHVVPVTVVRPHAPAETVRSATALAVDAERRLRAHGIAATGLVVEADEVAAGIHRVVRSEDATLVVMGWRGETDATRAFDATVDDVVGRSSVPLLVIRPADHPTTRVVLPLTAAHVGPHGRAGLALATTLTQRLAETAGTGVSVLWAGDEDPAVPDEVRDLTDRLHHDPRRLDQAVGAMARPGDVVVAAVAPTASGLREVTQHITAATPDAALVVAIDPGPRPSRGLGRAVAAPVNRVLELAEPAEHHVTVTIDPPVGTTVPRRRVVRALSPLGSVSDVEVEWRAATGAQRLRVTVRVLAVNPTTALGEVMTTLHETPALVGAAVRYDVSRAPEPLRLDRLEVLGAVEQGSEPSI